MSTEYNFIVHTNKYAGNFEREMCAYMCGRFGDCFVGEEIAEIAYEEITEQWGENIIDEIDDKIVQSFDDEGCRRPVSIITTPNDSKYHSFAISMDNVPSDALVQVLKIRAYEFANQTWNFGRYARTPRYESDRASHLTPIKGLEVLGFSLKKIETLETFTEI